MELVKEWFNPRSLYSASDLADMGTASPGASYLPDAVNELWTSTSPWHPIPEELLSLYGAVGRTTPLTRATRLAEALGTEATILLKREDVLINGSFKSCTALAQAHAAHVEGRKGAVVETGAGQTGLAASLACSLFGLTSTIFMVRTSYDSKPQRARQMMMLGSSVQPSPSSTTKFGRSRLEQGLVSGSIADATAEVVEVLDSRSDLFNIAGSLLDFTLAHSTLIGLEVANQLDRAPDVVIGSVGAGSSFGGLVFPLLRREEGTEFVAVESQSIPTLTKGEYRHDHPDGAGQEPTMKMLTLGYDFAPPPTHGTGLRYHAASPLVSKLVHDGSVNAVALSEQEAIDAARLVARTEGLIIAPECSYSFAELIRRAPGLRPDSTVVVLVSGSGLLDIDSYFTDDAPCDDTR